MFVHHAFILSLVIYFCTAASVTQTESCKVYPSLPQNSQRKCITNFCTITCMNGYEYIDGSTAANIRCENGEWQPTVSDCVPRCDPPCLNSGACVAPNICLCNRAFKGIQCQNSACDRPCENNGVCTATNTCQCRPNYYGAYCENTCLKYPYLTLNSHTKCSPNFCTVTCLSGYTFSDGSTVTEMHCVEGVWRSSNNNLSSMQCMPKWIFVGRSDGGS